MKMTFILTSVAILILVGCVQATFGDGEEGQKDCGRSLLNLKIGDSGMIQSPNYPNKYSPGLNCVWKLEAEPGSIIQATLFDIRIKSPNFNGLEDTLSITLNRVKGKPQRYSGDMNGMTPFNLISSTNQLTIQLTTSATSFGARGFNLGYHVTRKKRPVINSVTGAACDYSPIRSSMLKSNSQKSLTRNFESREAQEEFALAKLRALNALKRNNSNPFLVGLVLDDEYFCSGVLIRNDLVLTTAHCSRGVKKIDLIFGTEDLTLNDIGVQKRSVNSTSVHEHPSYDSTSGSHDLSAIKLTPPVLLTKFVKVALLPDLSSIGQFYSGFETFVSGWGDFKDNSVKAVATSKSLLIASNTVCRSLVHKKVNGLMLCSLGGRNDGKECQADTGSPMTVRCYPGNSVNNAAGSIPGPPKPQRPPRPPRPSRPQRPPQRPQSQPKPKPKPNPPTDDYDCDEDDEDCEYEEECEEGDPDCDPEYEVPDDPSYSPIIVPADNVDDLVPCDQECEDPSDAISDSDCDPSDSNYPNCVTKMKIEKEFVDRIENIVAKNNLKHGEDNCFLYNFLASETNVEMLLKQGRPISCPKFNAKSKQFPFNPQQDCQDFWSTDSMLIGLVSFGSCEGGFVSTRMTANVDFVQSIMAFN